MVYSGLNAWVRTDIGFSTILGTSLTSTVVAIIGTLLIWDNRSFYDYIANTLGGNIPDVETKLGTSSAYKSVTGGSRDSVRGSTSNHPFGTD